eukprot:6190568-Pleurochrysis_carterae.AAC.1
MAWFWLSVRGAQAASNGSLPTGADFEPLVQGTRGRRVAGSSCNRRAFRHACVACFVRYHIACFVNISVAGFITARTSRACKLRAFFSTKPPAHIDAK